MSNSLTVEKDALNMSRFLNRILGLPVNLQNQLFSYFTDTLAAVCQQAKKLGKFDSGIQDFGAQGEHVEVVEMREYVGDPAFGTATTQLVKVLWGEGKEERGRGERKVGREGGGREGGREGGVRERGGREGGRRVGERKGGGRGRREGRTSE